MPTMLPNPSALQKLYLGVASFDRIEDSFHQSWTAVLLNPIEIRR